MSRLRLIVGILLLVLGAAAVVMFARVLSTFLLEMVVDTLDSNEASDLPSYEFSWGTMEWGNMTRDFSAVTVGLVLIAFGQFLVLPAAIVRPGSKVRQCALIGASVMTLIAAVSYFFVPLSAIRAFGILAESGVADPVFLGEQLAVRANGVFTGCLVGAQVLFIVAALTAGRPVDGGSATRPAGNLLLAWLACTCTALFALLIVFVWLVPMRTLADFGEVTTASDPAEIARVISLALRTMLLATPLLVISGILVLIAGLLRQRSDVC